MYRVGVTLLREAVAVCITQVAAFRNRTFFRNGSLVARRGTVTVESVTKRETAAKRPEFAIMTDSWVKVRTGHRGLRPYCKTIATGWTC